MVDRSIAKLEETEAVDISPAKRPLVSMNYPQPILLSAVLADVAQWSSYSIIMDPSLNREIQVFAPHKIDTDAAFNLLLATLETTGLRIIKLDKSVIKVVEALSSKLSA